MRRRLSITSLQAYWNYLIGDSSVFPLESRIYNAFCVIALIAITYEIPFNYIIGLPVSALLSAILLVAQFILYYLSRFKMKNRISFLLSALLIHAVIILNYFYNSGIRGPSLLLFVFTFFLIIAVAPSRQYFTWIVINLLSVSFVLVVEYLFPDTVLYTYQSRGDVFTDNAYTYLIAIALIYVGIFYIRNSYYREKSAAEKRAMQLEELNTEKNRLLSIISHDLRAPLSTIQHYLNLLTEIELEPEEKLQFENDLLQITRNTQDMLYNLLSWSKSQLNGQSLNLSPVSISKALEPVLEAQKILSRQKDIEFIYEINSSEIIADPDMFQLVVRNILSNAIKFTNKGGRISLTTFEQDDACIICVKDNGIGIPESQHKDLFSLKAQSTYGTTQEKGVGLGLVLCKDFTEAQKGRLWFESEENQGTSFYISMPLHLVGKLIEKES